MATAEMMIRADAVTSDGCLAEMSRYMKRLESNGDWTTDTMFESVSVREFTTQDGNKWTRLRVTVLDL